MSLNKLTTSSDYLEKQYLNIGCNDIKCTSLEIGGTPIVPTNIPVSGKYDATMTANVAGTSMTNGWVYWEAIGNQLKLTFSRIVVIANNTSSIIFTIDLPAGYTSVPVLAVAGVAYVGDGIRELHMTVSSVYATGDKFNVICVGQNTLNLGTNYLNGSFVVEI